MTDTVGLTSSELAAIRHQRHLERAERRGAALAARKAEVLDPAFLRDALCSKVGLRHAHAAVSLHAHGQTGGLTTGELRDALQGVFATKKGKPHG